MDEKTQHNEGGRGAVPILLCCIMSRNHLAFRHI